MTLQDELAVQPEGRVERLRLHERVAILIPTDPGAELEDPPELRSISREPAGKLILELPIHVQGGRDQRVLEIEQCALYLVGDLRATSPVLVCLPENRDFLGQVLLQAPPFLPSEHPGL